MDCRPNAVSMALRHWGWGMGGEGEADKRRRRLARKREKMQILPSAGLIFLVLLMPIQKKQFFFLWIWASQDAAMLVCSLSMKRRKMLAYYVCNTFATNAGLVHGVTDTDCWTQNGSSHDRVFATFKYWSLRNMRENRRKDWKRIFAESSFMSPRLPNRLKGLNWIGLNHESIHTKKEHTQKNCRVSIQKKKKKKKIIPIYRSCNALPLGFPLKTVLQYDQAQRKQAGSMSSSRATPYSWALFLWYFCWPQFLIST